jgi:type III secretion system FlhB-like substrate exporter
MPETGTSPKNRVLEYRRRHYNSPHFSARYRTYVTAAEIVKKLQKEGVVIKEKRFMKLMLVENLFTMERAKGINKGGFWRCKPYEARLIVELIKEYLGYPSVFGEENQ